MPSRPLPRPALLDSDATPEERALALSPEPRGGRARVDDGTQDRREA
jgi:hypothetical protein